MIQRFEKVFQRVGRDSLIHDEEEVDVAVTIDDDGLPHFEARKDLNKALGEYEKAFKNPTFLRKIIFDRDRPIHEKWCSTKEADWVNGKLEEYLLKEVRRVRKERPFELFEDVSVVYPAVDTIDLFNMLNSLPSFKSDTNHWTGHAEQWAKMWSELDVRRYLMGYGARNFIKKFSRTNDVVTLVKLLNETSDTEERRTEEDVDDDLCFKQYAKHLKSVMYKSWYGNIDEAVDSLGDPENNVKADMKLMTSYRMALGLVPYERRSKRRNNNNPMADEDEGPWMSVRHDIPDPYSVMIVRDMRDKKYMCWNFKRSSKPSLIFFDTQQQLPFATKLKELLKMEYVYADMFRKQNSTHLSNGYILVEDRDSVAEAAVRAKQLKKGDGADAAAEAAKRDDKADEEDWKDQLRDLDDEVRELVRMDHKPAKPVFRGLARPNRMGYIDRLYNWKASGGGKSSSKNNKGDKVTGMKETDPAADLVKMLQKQIMTGEASTQSLTQMIRSLVGEENKYLSNASKRVSEIANNKHKFIQMIHKNLRSVEQEMNKIEGVTSSVGGSGERDKFGLLPIKAMFAALNNHTTTIEDMVHKLETSLLSVGINVNSEDENAVFSEFNARVTASTTSAVSNAHMEMRKIMDTIAKMLNQVETTVDNFSSTPYKQPVDAYYGVDALPSNFNMLGGALGEDNMPTILNAPPPASTSAAADEMYAYCQSKVKAIADMYKILVDRYNELLKNFKEQ